MKINKYSPVHRETACTAAATAAPAGAAAATAAAAATVTAAAVAAADAAEVNRSSSSNTSICSSCSSSRGSSGNGRSSDRCACRLCLFICFPVCPSSPFRFYFFLLPLKRYISLLCLHNRSYLNKLLCLLLLLL